MSRSADIVYNNVPPVTGGETDLPPIPGGPTPEGPYRPPAGGPPIGEPQGPVEGGGAPPPVPVPGDGTSTEVDCATATVSVPACPGPAVDQGGSLPVTGFDALFVLAAGAVALGTGFALRRRAR